MTRRIEQIEATLRRELGMALERGLADPRIKGLVSVTQVHLTEDQHTAVVSVSVLPQEHGRQTVRALGHAAAHLRALVGKRIEMRQIPRLEFKLDESLKKQSQVLAALNEVMKEKQAEDDGREPSPQEKPY